MHCAMTSTRAHNPQRRHWSTSVPFAPALIVYVQQSAKLFSLLLHVAVWLQSLVLVLKELDVDTFDVLTKQRYLDNIQIVDSVDLYSLLNFAWSNKEADFPVVSYSDMVKYFIS